MSEENSLISPQMTHKKYNPDCESFTYQIYGIAPRKNNIGAIKCINCDYQEIIRIKIIGEDKK